MPLISLSQYVNFVPLLFSENDSVQVFLWLFLPDVSQVSNKSRQLDVSKSLIKSGKKIANKFSSVYLVYVKVIVTIMWREWGPDFKEIFLNKNWVNHLAISNVWVHFCFNLNFEDFEEYEFKILYNKLNILTFSEMKVKICKTRFYKNLLAYWFIVLLSPEF